MRWTEHGKEFRRLRQYFGLTREQIAASLHISVGTVRNFELGTNKPNVDNYEGFLEILGKWKEETDPEAKAKKATCEPERVVCGQCGMWTLGPGGGGGVQPLWCCFCGAPLGIKCPRCGVIENRSGARFCRECGTRIVVDESSGLKGKQKQGGKSHA